MTPKKVMIGPRRPVGVAVGVGVKVLGDVGVRVADGARRVAVRVGVRVALPGGWVEVRVRVTLGD